MTPLRYLSCNSIHFRNGKTDKRALRQLALESVGRGDAVVKSNDSQYKQRTINFVPLKKLDIRFPHQQPMDSFDGTLWLDLVSTPTTPPPVYQRDFKPFDLSATHAATLRRSTSSVLPPTLAGSTEVSSVEKGNTWDGYEEDTLPEKTQGKLVRNLRHQIFSLYRRLFGVVFVANMAIFIATLVRGRGGNSITALQLGQIVVANLFCAILMRQDYVVNAFFTIFCSVPTS